MKISFSIACVVLLAGCSSTSYKAQNLIIEKEVSILALVGEQTKSSMPSGSARHLGCELRLSTLGDGLTMCRLTLWSMLTAHRVMP